MDNNPIRPWSFSSLLNYERCAHSISFPYKHIDSEASIHGESCHTLIESYLKNPTTTAPFDAFPLEQLAAKKPSVEEKWGLDINWNLTSWKDAWLRMICDAVTENPITIIDYKTGKRDGNEIKHAQQTQLYATGAAALFKNESLFHTELWYLDHGITVKNTYTRSQVEKFQSRWHARGLKMTTDTKLLANPSKSNCKYCVHKDDCEFSYEYP